LEDEGDFLEAHVALRQDHLRRVELLAAGRRRQAALELARGLGVHLQLHLVVARLGRELADAHAEAGVLLAQLRHLPLAGALVGLDVLEPVVHAHQDVSDASCRAVSTSQCCLVPS
jgi:hypothetical protein